MAVIMAFFEMAVGALTRQALAGLTVYLIQRHLLTADHAAAFSQDAVHWLVMATPAAVAVLWSIGRKYKDRIKLLTLLDRSGVSEASIERTIKNGLGASLSGR